MGGYDCYCALCGAPLREGAEIGSNTPEALKERAARVKDLHITATTTDTTFAQQRSHIPHHHRSSPGHAAAVPIKHHAVLAQLRSKLLRTSVPAADDER